MPFGLGFLLIISVAILSIVLAEAAAHGVVPSERTINTVDTSSSGDVTESSTSTDVTDLSEADSLSDSTAERQVGTPPSSLDLPPLPEDLPGLRWEQDPVSIRKCCDDDEALVSTPDGKPSCQPVAHALRWHPLILNGRSLLRAPPDDRTRVESGTNVTCEEGHFWQVGGFELLTTGQLYLRHSDALFPTGGFCADRILTENSTNEPQVSAARLCSITMHQESSLLDVEALYPHCHREFCLRKCCPRGLQFRASDQACIPQSNGSLWTPTFYRDETHTVTLDRYRIVPGNPACQASPDDSYGGVFALQPFYTDEDAFHVQLDGRLWVPHQEMYLDAEQFCVDQTQYLNGDKLEDHPFGIVCFGEPRRSTRTFARVVRGLLLVSMCFLLVTFVIYAAIAELRNVHGRCLMSLVAALFTACACIVVGQTHAVISDIDWCQITAIFMHYSVLAFCFWFNAMSFDIWWTFSRTRTTAAVGSKTRRFIRYSLYCWLTPLLFTVVIVFMQLAPDDLVPPEDYLRPGLGVENCWFSGGWGVLVYLHAPLLLLMLVNVVFFILTALALCRSEKDSQMVRKQKTGLERLKIYANLFCIMGISWITEGISMHLGDKSIWYVSDTINALQGFIIFIMFTLRGRSRKVILRHLDSWGFCRWCRCCRSSSIRDGRALGTLSSNKTRTTSLPSGTSTKRANEEQTPLAGTGGTNQAR